LKPKQDAAPSQPKLEKIRAFTNTTCPHSGTQIEPKDYKRLDWESAWSVRRVANSSFPPNAF